MQKRSLCILIISSIFISSCGERKQIGEFISPNGDFVIRSYVSDLGAVGSTHFYIEAFHSENESETLEEIFHGTNADQFDVYWENEYTLVIKFCLGETIRFKSKYKAEKIRRIHERYIPTFYVNLISTPNTEIDARLECHYPEGEWPKYLEIPR